MRLNWKRLTQSGIGLTLLATLLILSTMALLAEDGEGETPLPWATSGEPAPDQLRADGALQVAAVDAAGLVNDDFNSCQLDEEIWTYLDPLGAGATKEMNGTQLSITVPPGNNYSIWKEANHAPRVLQDVQNGEFEVVVKFDSIPTEKYQLQGITVQGGGDDDANKLLRFEFYSGIPDPDPETGGPRLYALAGALIELPGTLPDGSPNDFGYIPSNGNKFIGTVGDGSTDAVSPTQSIYMRVTRGLVGGNYQWKQQYSLDEGETWTPPDGDADSIVDFSGATAGNIPFDYNNLLPVQVGVYAGDDSGNANNPAGSPGHTAIFDYFITENLDVDPGDPKGYDVTTDTIGSGSVTVTPNGAGPYACGDNVTLTPVPELGWGFDSWSGDVSGNDDPLIVPFEMGLMATATFSEQQEETRTLDVTVTGEGAVTSADGKIDCGGDCAEIYVLDATVTLTATPASGYVFSQWTGDLPGGADPNNPLLELTMDDNKAVTAAFEQESAEQFTVTTQVFSNGTVTSTPAGIDCKAGSAAEDCTEKYDVGGSVTLTATPDAGYVFAGWTGDVTSTDASITVDDDTFVIATFAEEDQVVLTVSVSGENEGVVKSNVGGIDCPGACTASYAPDDAVTLKATAADGYEFDRWTGDLPSGADPASSTLALVMDANKSVTAEFKVAVRTVYLPIVHK